VSQPTLFKHVPRHPKIRLPHASNVLPFELECPEELIERTRHAPPRRGTVPSPRPPAQASAKPRSQPVRAQEEESAGTVFAHAFFVLAVLYLVLCWMFGGEITTSPHRWIIVTLVGLGCVCLVVGCMQDLTQKILKRTRLKKKMSSRYRRKGPSPRSKSRKKR